jgi:hypothetical protein
MSANTSTKTESNDLEELARQIKSWRERYPDKYIPKMFWIHALDLIELHPIEDVAKRTGLKLKYLRRKLKRRNSDSAVTDIEKEPTPQFVEVPVAAAQNILNVSKPLTMRLRNPNGLQIDLTFAGELQEVFSFIKELVQGGESCSK